MNAGVLSFVVPRFTSLILIFAIAAVFERGTYPILRASETTFSRTVAESKNDSFATKSVSYTHLTLPTSQLV